MSCVCVSRLGRRTSTLPVPVAASVGVDSGRVKTCASVQRTSGIWTVTTGWAATPEEVRGVVRKDERRGAEWLLKDVWFVRENKELKVEFSLQLRGLDIFFKEGVHVSSRVEV